MERGELEARKREIEARFGPWTAHNIQLQRDIYTIASGSGQWQGRRLARIIELVTCLAPRPIPELRVLDLGALEGLFSVELARRGASVIAVEGREANVEKIRLAKDALELDNLQAVHGDLRDVSRDVLGVFDVVLALGVVCLLDTPDVFRFVERLVDLCDGVLIAEINPAPRGTAVRVHGDRTYHGGTAPGEAPDGVLPGAERAEWTAIGNGSSFRLTPPSFCNLLADNGFGVVLRCEAPVVDDGGHSATFAAFKVRPAELASLPDFVAPAERLREPLAPATALVLSAGRRVARAVIPAAVRPRVRRLGARLVPAALRSSLNGG